MRPIPKNKKTPQGSYTSKLQFSPLFKKHVNRKTSEQRHFQKLLRTSYFWLTNYLHLTFICKFTSHLVNFVTKINVFQTTRLVNEVHNHPSVKHAIQHELNLKFPLLLDLESHLVNFVTTINVFQTTRLANRVHNHPGVPHD